MVYLRATMDFMYHKDFYNKRGREYTKYYNINPGQLLTVCEAIQRFDMELDDILFSYPLEFIQINRKHTVRTTAGRYLTETGDLLYYKLR